MRFEVPAGTIVHANGAPNVGGTGPRRYAFNVNAPSLFNFAAGRFRVASSVSSARGVPTTLTYYLTPRDNAGTYAKQSLAVMRALSEEFGPYPYDRFAIIELPTDLAQRAGFGGASVEGGILSTTTFLDRPFNSAYYGHEIGHQWWGVTIRPTGARGALMLQEGMAQYGALRAVELIDGSQSALGFRQREYPDYFGQGGELYFRIVDGGHDAPLADLPVNEEWARDIVDSKGFMVLNVLSNEIGRERLQAAFHQILRDFGPSRLTWDDFVGAITKAAGRDLSWFFDQWFYKTGAPELAAELDMPARQARVQQLGDPYQLKLDLAFVGPGCESRTQVTITRREERVPFPIGCHPDSVVVDPDYQVPRWTPELRQRYRRAR
jgi:aminopeptidase N